MTDWVKVECPLCGEMAVAETHPNLKREWVGLNWDDLPEIYVGDKAFLHGAKWAEAMLRSKNT